MKVLLVHNEYGKFSGEEAVFCALERLLLAAGHDVRTFVRSSRNLPSGLRGNVIGFAAGIWSPTSRRDFSRLLDKFCPDVVQIQNLFPLVSASIVGEVKRRRIPLVMACHNYRLFCPTGLMLRGGVPCTKCATGGVKWCVRHNCEGSFPRSVGYALRNRVAQPRLLESVNVFTVLSSFQRDRFIEWGIEPERIAVVPNFIDEAQGHQGSDDEGEEDARWVGYAGRISREKGVEVLLRAAAKLPNIPFRIAGHAARMPDVATSGNVTFTGEIPSEEMPAFYRGCRFTVAPSLWFEGMPMVVVEAMLAARPVIASRIGGLVDLVKDGQTGFLTEPGDSETLAAAIRALWGQPERCAKMGAEAREIVRCEYNRERYYERTMQVFGTALQKGT